VKELLKTLVESKRVKDIDDFVLLQVLDQLSMFGSWTQNKTIPKYLFKYCRTLKTVQATACVRAIHEETVRAVRDVKRAMEKDVVDAYMPDCAPLVNVCLILTTFSVVSTFSLLCPFFIEFYPHSWKFVHFLLNFIYICKSLSIISVILSTWLQL